MKDIGLVLVEGARAPGLDPLVSGFGHGLEDVLLRNEMRLTTRIVRDDAAEESAYRSWATSGAVDAVVLLRLRTDDERTVLLERLDLPFAAVLDGPDGGDHAGIVVDETASMRAVLDHLVSRGHGDVVHVGDGDARRGRETLFADAVEEHGVRGRVVTAPPTRDGGRSAVTTVLALEPRPTAVVFDDDVSAVAAVEELRARGITVPDDLAVVAWNDSALCQASEPDVTAVRDESHEIGRLVGEALVTLGSRGENLRLRAPAPVVIGRSST